jgi:hypothetical protein
MLNLTSDIDQVPTRAQDIFSDDDAYGKQLTLPTPEMGNLEEIETIATNGLKSVYGRNSLLGCLNQSVTETHARPSLKNYYPCLKFARIWRAPKTCSDYQTFCEQ